MTRAGHGGHPAQRWSCGALCSDAVAVLCVLLMASGNRSGLVRMLGSWAPRHHRPTYANQSNPTLAPEQLGASLGRLTRKNSCCCNPPGEPAVTFAVRSDQVHFKLLGRPLKHYELLEHHPKSGEHVLSDPPSQCPGRTAPPATVTQTRLPPMPANQPLHLALPGCRSHLSSYFAPGQKLSASWQRHGRQPLFSTSA